VANSIKRVKSTPLYEQVAGQIENIIFRGEHKKGELLPSERELMDLTGVSRITVREALRHLAEVGIIETRKGKGSVVMVSATELVQLAANKEKYRMHRHDFEESTNTRILIEPEIARQVAISASQEDIERIGASFAGSAKYAAANKGSEALESFHRAIVLALGNSILLELFDNLTTLEVLHQPPLFNPPSRQVSIASHLEGHHRKIFEAIKENNGEFAYFHMKEHLYFLKKTYQRYFDHYFA
jgi:GntR family transcriptional repressor for pyruvate dehydrogenase complex